MFVTDPTAQELRSALKVAHAVEPHQSLFEQKSLYMLVMAETSQSAMGPYVVSAATASLQ